MLLLYLFLAVATPVLSFSRLRRGLHQPPKPVTHGMWTKSGSSQNSRMLRRDPVGRRDPVIRRQTAGSGTCGGGQLTTKAPKVNIFGSLSDEEAASVTSFLHDQASLNITAAAAATP